MPKKEVKNKKQEKPSKKIIGKKKAQDAQKIPMNPETLSDESAERNFSAPSNFMNRELSWLLFNERVLEEAQDRTNRPFERLKFLSITSSNLDEFFMVRVSGIMELIESGFTGRDASGLTAQEQFSAVEKRIHELVYKQYNCFNRSVVPRLQKEGIIFASYSELNENEQSIVTKYFESTVYPILTPMAIDQSRPFPLLSNRSLNIIVEIKDSESDEELFAVVQSPSVIPRFFSVCEEGGVYKYILIEEIIKEHIGKLFLGYTTSDAFAFRITRNSDLELDEEDADDLLNEIEKSIKKRKWGEPVRLEVEKAMTERPRRFLTESLELEEEDIYEISGPIDLTFLMSFALRKGFSQFRNEPLKPAPSVEFLGREVFETIREKDVLVYHPYESFDAVLNFIRAAASDPNVLAIKQTLYRVSWNSPIVAALISAAENGKQVTVLVELKARFDEANNILWAKQLEKAGCHVVYGLVGLKTHCKMCLVVRREEEGAILRYVHLGTGNYNENTATIYTDFGFFTCKKAFGQDASSLFNVLTGYSINMKWNKLSVAPVSLRDTFLKRIKTEEENAKAGKPAAIRAKMNSLVDTEIICALYKASAAGVKISLLIRGICCLKSGIPGISENITVGSIVDRFLEHSRVYWFMNDTNPVLYLSSADWMPRNFDRRVEVAFPIEDENLARVVTECLDVAFSDTVKLRIQQQNGEYSKVDRRGKETVHSQLYFTEYYADKFEKASKLELEEKLQPVFSPNV